MHPHGVGLIFVAASQQGLGPLGQNLRVIGGYGQNLVIEGNSLGKFTIGLILPGPAFQILEVWRGLQTEAAPQGRPLGFVPQSGMDVDHLPQHLLILGFKGNIPLKIGKGLGETGQTGIDLAKALEKSWGGWLLLKQRKQVDQGLLRPATLEIIGGQPLFCLVAWQGARQALPVFNGLALEPGSVIGLGRLKQDCGVSLVFPEQNDEMDPGLVIGAHLVVEIGQLFPQGEPSRLQPEQGFQHGCRFTFFLLRQKGRSRTAQYLTMIRLPLENLFVQFHRPGIVALPPACLCQSKQILEIPGRSLNQPFKMGQSPLFPLQLQENGDQLPPGNLKPLPHTQQGLVDRHRLGKPPVARQLPTLIP